MKQLAASLLILSLVLTSKVSAQEVVEVPVYRLPAGEFVDFDGVGMQCFTFSEYQELLRIDTDLHFAGLELQLNRDIMAEHEAAIIQLRTALASADVSINRLTDENLRIMDMWTEENRLRHLAENSPDALGWVGWAVGALAAVIAAALGVTLAVTSN